ncbi:hypothetical protein TI39_contig297g00006 [Zymoseptoria brevis]|uniref:Integral membrane protein n=1 Tax=Zymoseptoria brevis TaxID=1047168 RepID=A0A0F4GVP9_9PEZI|nr:hypothetical protein TI39_contig297g00006 [Zymoseptoria brevis]
MCWPGDIQPTAKAVSFNETIGSLLEDLTADEREALDVRLLFAHSEPSVHPDWNRTWLRAIDSWSGYDDLTKSELERVLIAEKDRNFYVKGVVGYTYMLNECLTHTTAPYIALFEDDVIFAEGWLAKTAAAILELRASTNWLYLRLFYTETSLGWDEDSDFWYRNMRLTLALAIVSTLTFSLSIRACSARLRPRLDLATIAVLALIVAPAFTQLVFMVGKYNLFPLQGVVRMDRFGCCTQGLVFPRAKAIDLLHALEGRDGQTDSMIEAYADEQGLERYALAPQVLQHVGLVSSRDNLAMNTQSTWAFWFEAQRPEVLKREHSKLAAEVDWKALRRGT